MNLNATLIFQALVFLVLALFTMRYIWPPLIRALDERAQRIAEGLAAAEKGKTELAATQAKVAQLDAQAKGQQQQRLQEAEKQAAQLIEQARRDAETERARILAQAEREAQQALQQARDQLRRSVAELAVKGAEQILRREVDAATHAQLLAQLQTEL